MAGGGFAFEDCLLKHYIRRHLWVPRCKERQHALKVAAGNKPARRLRYFTFCAEGALDVLLLDREKIVRRSSSTKEFDTVYFFDSEPDAIAETRKRIPGAIGFPGDFFEIMLETTAGTGLESPAQMGNIKAVREKQIKQDQRDQFKKAFPFDVLNLDVERYLFRPSEDLPGKIIQSLRYLLEWQTQTGMAGREAYTVDQFTLMFTTQVGPQGLPDEVITYLRDDCLEKNLQQNADLKPLFLEKSGGKNVGEFFEKDFDNAFKLAVPKSLIELVSEHDWYVDSDRGVEVFQFDRPSKSGPYCMLHMAMTVRRQKPRKEQRAPGQAMPADAATQQKKSIEKLFAQAVVPVEEFVIGEAEKKLKLDLESLFEHRSKYYKPVTA